MKCYVDLTLFLVHLHQIGVPSSLGALNEVLSRIGVNLDAPVESSRISTGELLLDTGETAKKQDLTQFAVVLRLEVEDDQSLSQNQFEARAQRTKTQETQVNSMHFDAAFVFVASLFDF